MKINLNNTDKIEKALLSVNGKAAGHTYTTADQIKDDLERVKKELDFIAPTKELLRGVRVTLVSGEKVPNSYKYTRLATAVILEYCASGWFIVDIKRKPISLTGGGASIYIPNDTKIVERFRARYTTNGKI